MFKALSKRNLFKEFKYVMEYIGHFKQQWFEFKDKWQHNFIAKQLKSLFLMGE